MTFGGLHKGLGLTAAILLMTVACQGGVDRSMTPVGTWNLQQLVEAELPVVVAGEAPIDLDDPETDPDAVYVPTVRTELTAGILNLKQGSECNGVLSYRHYAGEWAIDEETGEQVGTTPRTHEVFTVETDPDECTYSWEGNDLTINWSEGLTQNGTWSFASVRVTRDGQEYVYRR